MCADMVPPAHTHTHTMRMSSIGILTHGRPVAEAPKAGFSVQGLLWACESRRGAQVVFCTPARPLAAALSEAQRVPFPPPLASPPPVGGMVTWHRKYQAPKKNFTRRRS